MPVFTTSRNLQKAFYHGLRVLIGAAFIWASVDKIVDPGAFARIIENYQLLPAMLINPVALVLPWLELICGALMVSGYWVRGSGLILGILLAVFILALATNAYRGIDINCGCFSVDAAHDSDLFQLIVRDMIMLTGVTWVSYYRMKMSRVSRQPSARPVETGGA